MAISKVEEEGSNTANEHDLVPENLHGLTVLLPEETAKCFRSWFEQVVSSAFEPAFAEDQDCFQKLYCKLVQQVQHLQLPSDDDISCNALQAGEHLKKTEKIDSPTAIKDETNSLEKLQTKKQKGGDGGRGQDKEIDKKQEQQEEEGLRKRSATKPKFRPTRVAADNTLSKVLTSDIRLPSDDDISCNALQAGEHFKKTEKIDSPTAIKDETNSLEKLQTKKQKGGDGGRGQDKEIDKRQEQQEQEKQEELRKRSATKPQFRPTRVAADSTLSKVLNSDISCIRKGTIWMTLIVFLFMTHGASGANGNDGDCEVGTAPKCPISTYIPSRAAVKGDSITVGNIPGHDTKRYNLDLNVSVATPNGLKLNRCRVIRLVASNSTSCPGLGLGYEKNDANDTDIILRNVQEGFIFNLTVEGINYFSNFSGTVLVAAVTCPAITTTPPAIQLGCDQNHNATERTVCTFSCPSGYDGKGDAHKTCLPNGTWTSTDFNCEEASPNHDKSKVGLIVVIVVQGLVVIGLFVLVVYVIRIKKKQENQPTQGTFIQLPTGSPEPEVSPTRKGSRESGVESLSLHNLNEEMQCL